MKQKYDLIFSPGATCACSQTLRAAGLQYTSFPHDLRVGVPLEEQFPTFRAKYTRITDRPGYRIIDIDCCTLDGQASSEQKVMTIGRYLAVLLEVVDCRTAEEKREGPRKRRLARYGRFAAKTFWGYHWNRIQHRPYRHPYNRLQRKGLV